jgi:polyhydroxyalkanoate synthase
LLELGFYPLFHTGTFCKECDEEGWDVRFKSKEWQDFPWRLGVEHFLQLEDWWRLATTDVPGLAKPVERLVSFSARQFLDALSPSNFVLTSPDLFYETLRSKGLNLIHGSKIALCDMLEKLVGIPPAGVEHFIPGKDVALTAGKVVFSNHLIELIQYEAQTETVYKEPVLIIPAWIMKYYILDLSSQNSLVKWLVQQGHTVFMVSWRNPDSKDRNLSMDDYYRLGAMAAIDTVSTVCLGRKINLVGYCLGGTLSMITAAAMDGVEDKRLNSLSMLAAQADFSEAGELMLFVSEGEVAFLKNLMWEQGYLDTKQMAGAFQMLRSYDLIWSKMVHDYMSGTERGMIDLLAWNVDATRMPYKMQSQYLEKLFLNNEFAEGHYRVEGKLIAPKNIRVPAFVVSTEKDHIVPWRSVYKIHLLLHSPITFVLAKGGHNAGIISYPGKKGNYYRMGAHKKEASYIGSTNWLETTKIKKGSWWEAWHKWLVEQSNKKRVIAPKLNPSLPDAPGTYVLQK